MQFRNSARKTKSQLRMLDRTLKRTKKQLGLDEKKDNVAKDTIDSGYSPVEQ